MTEAQQIEDDIEEEEDETLSERLWGLTEMFPDTVRSATSTTVSYTTAGGAKVYRFVRSALWVGASSFVLLAVPVVFEQERYNLEQQQQQHQRQILLGPNVAASNVPGGLGMVPPPPPK